MTAKTDKIPSARQVGMDLLKFSQEHGVLPWEVPWISANGHHNPISGSRYTGTNPMILDVECFVREFSDPRWATFKQVKDNGGRVVKGAKSVMLLRAGRIVKEDDKTGDKRIIPFVRGFRVFNISETTGLDLPPLESCEVKHTSDTHKACDTIIESMPKRPKIVHAPGRAFYRPSTDTVSLPDRDQFKVQEQYDMVRFHEVIHATGHEQRLARPGITDANLFGDHAYSREELVAEIGAATLGRTVGLDRSKIDKASAAYLQSWLRKIADKPEAIITAANHAQAAADFVLGISDRYDNTEA